MSSPSCPQCGGVMEVKVAGKGANAGSRFWGCKRFPACKGTRPYDDDESGESIEQPRASGDIAPEELPHVVEIAPLYPELQGRLYQAVGLPQRFVERVHDADVPMRLRRAAGQWRLDLPEPGPRSEDIREQYGTVIAVVESILTRGAITFVDPAIEEALPDPPRELATDDDITGAVEELAAAPTIPFRPRTDLPLWGEGRRFAEWFFERGFDRQGWTIAPRVAVHPVFAEPGADRPPELPVVLAHPSIEVLTAVDVSGELTSPGGADRRSWFDRRLMEVIPGGGDLARMARVEEILRRAGSRPRRAGPLTDLRLARFGHQVQIAIFEAFRAGFFPNLEHWEVAILPPQRLTDEAAEHLELVLSAAAEGLAELVYRVACLHEVPLSRPTTRVHTTPAKGAPGAAVLVSAGQPQAALPPPVAGLPRLVIHDLPLGINVAAPISTTGAVRATAPAREHAEWMLRYIFRKQGFWEGQWETIRRTLQGKDTLVLLPTGGGKSIAFQLGALCLPGVCIAVDPIVSLIEDQIDNLRRVGIDRAIGISSLIRERQERDAAVNAMAQGRYLFCYVAPERFQISTFRDALRTLTAIVPVCSVAIDEAHCVSEWGHDFRTAYLNLGRIARDYCQKDGKAPPLVGLTGTASYIVLRDVQNELQIREFDALVTPTTFDRPELKFEVLRCASDEKVNRLVGVLSSLPSRFGMTPGAFFDPRRPKPAAGLIFCPFVRGPFGVRSIHEEVEKRLNGKFGIYAGQLQDDEKRSNARDFKRSRVHGLVCTKAFGMGIDKPNIRYTIHTGLPESIEAFYQEAGRAGRDRGRAYSFILLSDEQQGVNRQLLDPNTTVQDIEATQQNRRRYGTDDDVSRALWFHLQAFRGREQDLQTTRVVLELLGETGYARATSLQWRGQDPKRFRVRATGDPGKDGDAVRSAMEKVLHRLVVLGVVADYTVDYAHSAFEVKVAGADAGTVRDRLLQYVRGYQAGLVRGYAERLDTAAERPWDEFVLYACELLIDFIYEHIERARRRSLQEMLEAASAGDGEALRDRILNYLTTTEYDDYLVQMVNAVTEQEEHDAMTGLFELIVAPLDAERVRGAAGRYLTSYPDQPALLMVRAAAEALAREPDGVAVRQNLTAALQFGRTRYLYDDGRLARLAGTAIGLVAGRKPDMARRMALEAARAQADQPEFVRELARVMPEVTAVPAALVLAERLAARVDHILKAG